MIIKTLGEFRKKFADYSDDTPLSVWDDKLEQYGNVNICKDNGGICFSFSYKEKPKTADDYTNLWGIIDRSEVVKEAKEIIRQLDPQHEHKPKESDEEKLTDEEYYKILRHAEGVDVMNYIFK